jgi:hypothetical protein
VDRDKSAGHVWAGAPTVNNAVQATSPGKSRRKRSSSLPSDE